MTSSHPVCSPHLDKTNPHEDTRRDSVERTDGDKGGLIVAVELLQNTDANGHSDRSDEGKERSKTELLLHG